MYAIEILQYVHRGEAQHAIALRFDEPRPSRIISLGGVLEVLCAVDFDHQLRAERRKVGIIWTDLHLAPEVQRLERGQAQHCPHPSSGGDMLLRSSRAR